MTIGKSVALVEQEQSFHKLADSSIGRPLT